MVYRLTFITRIRWPYNSDIFICSIQQINNDDDDVDDNDEVELIVETIFLSTNKENTYQVARNDLSASLKVPGKWMQQTRAAEGSPMCGGMEERGPKGQSPRPE